MRAEDLPTLTAWHRIKEREEEKTPIAKGFAGGYVTTQRIIAHCGYPVSPLFLDGKELNEAAVDLIARRSGVSPLDTELVLAQAVRGEKFLLGDYYKSLRFIYRAVRERWVDEMRRSPLVTERDFRTFWYQDLNEPTDYWCERIAYKQIGWRSGSVIDENGCEPAYLDVKLVQGVYVYNVGFGSNKRTIYIHPLDVTGTPHTKLGTFMFTERKATNNG